MKPCQIEIEEYKDDFTDNKRLSFLLRKHIDECDDCQNKIINLSNEIKIDKVVFGVEIEKLKLRWIGEISNINLDSPSIFQYITRYSLKYKKTILSFMYWIMILALMNDNFF